METTTLVFLIIVIAVVAFALWVVSQRAKHRKLRSRFGPEYDRLAQEERDPSRVANLLTKREKRVAKYNIRPLTREEAESCTMDWRTVQEHFVDDPRDAVAQADALVDRALRARGYPMSDFEHQADDLSVDYPLVVEHYREAHAVAKRVGDASTEDLRRAMQHYRTLLENLIDSHVTMERR